MRSPRLTYALLLTLAVTPLAAAQSFDCKLAQSPREHAICSNMDLSALDSNVAAAYKAARSKLSPTAFALVQSDQRHWLRWLDKVCPPGDNIADCLTEHYNSRLRQLTRGIITTNGITFYPRAHYSVVPDIRKPEDRSPNDPGFIYDEDVFPQIDIRPDRPNPACAAWNATIQPQPSTNPSVNPYEDGVTRSETNYDVIAANDRLINISFTGWFYSGGAHPQGGESSNLWWLDKRRALIASDVFRPGSGWQQKLVDPAIRKLQTGYSDDGLLTGDRLRKAVTPAITRISAWNITSKGLTITFAIYEVGPHSMDEPDITFTWDELKPFLAPALQPSTLPSPLPKPNP
jgi:uncharacterized protein YecT (DUF1311 family)